MPMLRRVLSTGGPAGCSGGGGGGGGGSAGTIGFPNAGAIAASALSGPSPRATVAVVSSGAIALGARRLALAKGGRATLEDAQAAAAVGQIALSQVWADLLADHGITAAQMLVTIGDLEDRRRYLNAAATLERLIGLGVVPVVNENDSVATEEIRFGDNDRLAARIGQAARADAVVLLSDIDGLYTANPHSDPDAKLVPLVETLDAKTLAMGDANSASGMGSGGMVSKLQAAQIATGAGAHLAIISGRVNTPLTEWIKTGRGTLFLASTRRGARKDWLAGRLTVKGRLVVDAGASLRIGVLGDRLAAIAVRNGWAGVVINGAIRDHAELRKGTFPVFAAGTHPAGPSKKGDGSVLHPIVCAGAPVRAGDWIHGDCDGVVVVPMERKDELLAAAHAKYLREQERMAAIARGELKPAWLDAAKWGHIRPGMTELEVLTLLGPPASMREAEGGRLLHYAQEIGASAFLAGSVRLKDGVVAEVQIPRLR